MTNKTIRLSPTTLSAWFSSGCPAAWKFSRDYDRAVPQPNFQLGTLVHALLDGSLDPNDTESSVYPWASPAFLASAATVFKKLIALKSALGLTVLRDPHNRPLVEQKLVWRLLPGIEFVVKLDFIGLDMDGTPVIVDWKSSLGTGWKSIPLPPDQTFTPQANGFQSIGYLIAPPATLRRKLGLPIPDWPKKLYYLVGPLRGAAQVYPYEWNDDDYANFKKALRLAAESIRANVFPKVYGYHCHDCGWRGPCFRYDGWQEHYTPRQP